MAPRLGWRGFVAGLLIPSFFLFLAFGGARSLHAATQQQVADYVRDNLLGGTFGDVNLWMTASPLNATHVARDRDLAVPDQLFPYALTWLVMIDDEPKANWDHPVRWVFVDDTLTQHTGPLPKTLFPTVWAGSGAGPEVNLECVSATPTPCVDSTAASISTAAERAVSLAQTVTDKDCLHAVLISGGVRADPQDMIQLGDKPRYAQNLRSMYRKLRAAGYPAGNISVYYRDGMKPLDLDNSDGDNNDATGSDPLESVEEDNIRNRISHLCQSLDPDRDVLFIYTSNHGKENAGLHLWDFNGNQLPNGGKEEPNEIYTVDEFAADTKDCQVCRLFVLMDQCHSGQFTSVATDGDHANMAIYTAASSTKASFGRQYMSYWENLDVENSTMAELHESVAKSMADDDPTSMPQSAEGTPGNGDVSLATCWEKATDCVLSGDGTATFSPGLWTRDGVSIGETFPGGVTPPPGETVYDTTGLPKVPNDWHFSVDFFWQSHPVHVAVWFVGFSPEDSLGVQIYCNPKFLEYHLEVNVAQDQYSISPGTGGPPIHTGTWSGYPGNLPAGFTATGHYRLRRGQVVSEIPTLSWTGIAILVLLSVAIGLFFLLRRRAFRV